MLPLPGVWDAKPLGYEVVQGKAVLPLPDVWDVKPVVYMKWCKARPCRRCRAFWTLRPILWPYRSWRPAWWGPTRGCSQPTRLRCDVCIAPVSTALWDSGRGRPELSVGTCMPGCGPGFPLASLQRRPTDCCSSAGLFGNSPSLPNPAFSRWSRVRPGVHWVLIQAHLCVSGSSRCSVLRGALCCSALVCDLQTKLLTDSSAHPLLFGVCHSHHLTACMLVL